MDKVKNALWALMGFLIFLFSTTMFIDEIQDFRSTIRSEQTSLIEVAISGKQVERSYLGKNRYLVMLSSRIEEKVSVKLPPGSYSEVSKEEYAALLPGDKIQGTMKGTTFYTKLDGKEAHKEHWIMLLVTAMYPLGYLIYQLAKLFVHLKVTNPVVNSFGSLVSVLLAVGLGALMLACFVLMFSDLFRWLDESIGAKTHTVAKITDSVIDISHGKYAETNYYLAFNFMVDGETFHMTKEVSKHDYNENWDHVRIRYPEGHPDRVSISGYTLWDAFYLFSNSWIVIYLCVIAITVLFIGTGVMLKRKKRLIEESRKQSRRKFRKR